MNYFSFVLICELVSFTQLYASTTYIWIIVKYLSRRETELTRCVFDVDGVRERVAHKSVTVIHAQQAQQPYDYFTVSHSSISLHLLIYWHSRVPQKSQTVQIYINKYICRFFQNFINDSTMTSGTVRHTCNKMSRLFLLVVSGK